MFGGQAGAEALGGRTRGHAERAIPEIPPVGPAEQRDGERRIGVFQPRRGLPERGRAERHEQDREQPAAPEPAPFAEAMADRGVDAAVAERSRLGRQFEFDRYVGVASATQPDPRWQPARPKRWHGGERTDPKNDE